MTRALPAGENCRSSTRRPESILKLLRIRAKSDYRYYKKATILRRIQRRMALRQIASMDDYLKLLQKDEAELTQLSKDMLIGVSSFFRDPEAFETLRSEVIVPLVEGEGCRQSPAGVGAGLRHGRGGLLGGDAPAGSVPRPPAKRCPVQVFASDVDEHALEAARAGVYPECIADDSPGRSAGAILHEAGPDLAGATSNSARRWSSPGRTC